MKEKQAVKEAFTELAPRYEEVLDDELSTFWGLSYQAYVNLLVKRTDISEYQKILDIATGTAMIPRKIIKKNMPGVHVTGLDITESMLRQGKHALTAPVYQNKISLTCGDAMALPFAAESFDVIVTGLATHHMDISRMLNEIKRTIKKNGTLSMIDVGVSPIWHTPIISGLARVFVFVLFLFRENITRAYAEAAAISNVLTAEEWQEALLELGFSEIIIEEIPGIHRWLPTPLEIRATFS
ncbi:MAG: class I SAM-dependent methyltransferase [Anaerolineales bacterium]